jgi:hypothetical protein
MGGLLFMLMIGLILLPITVVLLILRVTSKKAVYVNAIGFLWLGVLAVIVLLEVISMFTKNKTVLQTDIYGEYIIDRSKYPGKQADWQYNSFRFEITPQNDFLFYRMDQGKVIQSYKGKVDFRDGYTSPRLVLKFDTLQLDIIERKPTLYRKPRGFSYVFKSSRFGNMFFKQGKWKPIEKQTD